MWEMDLKTDANSSRVPLLAGEEDRSRMSDLAGVLEANCDMLEVKVLSVYKTRSAVYGSWRLALHESKLVQATYFTRGLLEPAKDDPCDMARNQGSQERGVGGSERAPL